MKAKKKSAAKARRKTAATPRKPVKARPALRPPAAKATPPAASPAPEPTPARLTKLVEVRLKQRAGEFVRTRAKFERVARGLQSLVVAASGRAAKGGPRRFRPAPVQAREYQRQMAELSTELRLITARRAELAWIHLQLTGKAPELSASLKALVAARAAEKP